MDQNKREYILKAERETKILLENLSSRPIVVHYTRDKYHQKNGVVFAYVHPTSEILYMGWSRCNLNCDKFYRGVALSKAFTRSIPVNANGTEVDDVPWSMQETFLEVRERATKAYQKWVETGLNKIDGQEKT